MFKILSKIWKTLRKGNILWHIYVKYVNLFFFFLWTILHMIIEHSLFLMQKNYFASRRDYAIVWNFLYVLLMINATKPWKWLKMAMKLAKIHCFDWTMLSLCLKICHDNRDCSCFLSFSTFSTYLNYWELRFFLLNGFCDIHFCNFLCLRLGWRLFFFSCWL